MDEDNVAEMWDYHRLTSHRPSHRAGTEADQRLVSDYQPMDPRRRPPPFKRYPTSHRRVAVPERLDQALFLSAGVVRQRSAGGGTIYYRAAGSAGNLAPLEVYVVVGGHLHHYEPLEHQLALLGPAPDGPDTLIITGVPWRTAWKYTERGFRHLYWDCGTMLSQLLALVPSARIEMGFADGLLSDRLGLDDAHEFPLAVLVVGSGEATVGRAGERPDTVAVAPNPVDFPLIRAAQRAGDLRDGEVEAWRRQQARPPAPTDVTFGQAVPEVIGKRGSTRAFDPEALGPPELLHDALQRATAPVRGDFVAGDETLLEHHTLVHAIEREASQPGSRALGRQLCLGQPLGGDGCYTAFHCSDLTIAMTALGARGYRCAQLEAGIVEGRLHLAAFALGYGASGLTFFDSVVRSTFAIDAWPMLVTAVGKPVRPPAPIGTPGRPARLRPQPPRS